MLSALDELALLLRPAGGGLFLVSTGKDAQLALQRKIYGASTEAEVDRRFRESLAKIPSARGVLLGSPSDVGAGYRRGANLGPEAIRTELISKHPDLLSPNNALGLIDIGDVFVCPQLLHDSMLSDAQIEASRTAMYPNVDREVRATLPVSPLSIAERALDLVFQLNPKVRTFVMGGDHSNSWPVVAAMHRAQNVPFGIVQPDAHTDLLEERLGIRYCFATWSFHANDLVGRKGRLVQVGTRASRREKAHWESTLGVKQFWAEECLNDPKGAMDRLIQHVKDLKVPGVYFSNDVDGTDAAFADATGTPEPGGLHPDFVVELIRRLGREVGILGGDIMEVAPPLQDKPDSRERTVSLGAMYLYETIVAALSNEAP